jgi:hypothetical protein
MIVANLCTILQTLEMGDAGKSKEPYMRLVDRHDFSERESSREQISREELVERIARAVREDGTAEPL